MTSWMNETDVRVMGLPNGVRMRVTGFTPDFPAELTGVPESVRLEGWIELTKIVDLTFDPDVIRIFAGDIIAMCNFAQGRP